MDFPQIREGRLGVAGLVGKAQWLKLPTLGQAPEQPFT